MFFRSSPTGILAALLATSSVLLSTTSIGVRADGDHDSHFNLEKMDLKMPLTSSDFTATYFDGSIGAESAEKKSSSSIILIGGCSAKNGNVWIGDAEYPGYYCGEFTKKVSVFYPEFQTFGSLEDLPEARLRHTAVVVDKKIYVIGGRNEVDGVIADVIVFDPEIQQWKPYITLDGDHAASDQGAVARDGKIYVFGGWPEDYSAAMANAYSIDTRNGGKIEDLESMFTPRGDVSAVRFNHGKLDRAYVIGGFTEANEFCAPLSTVEHYDFGSDTWTQSSSEELDLISERGDKATVVMDEKILVIGGEDKHEDMCSADSEDLNPHQHSQAVDEVEVLDPLSKTPKWTKESNLPDIRFRAASAVDKKSNTLYLFGGQKAYEKECDCYKTSDDIYVYQGHQDRGGLGGLGIALIVSGSFLVAVVAAICWRRNRAGKASGMESAV